jgi:hypothetical protein
VSLQDDAPAAIEHWTLVPGTGAAPFLMTEKVSVGLPVGAAVSAPVVIVSSATPKFDTVPASVTGNSTFKAVVLAFPTEAVVVVVTVQFPNDGVQVEADVAATLDGLFNPIATANCAPDAAV